MAKSKNKISLAPIEDSVPEPAAENASPKNDEIQEPSIDSYLSTSSDPSCGYTEKDAEIEVLNETIRDLKNEISNLRDENAKIRLTVNSLMRDLESARRSNGNTPDVNDSEMKSVRDENMSLKVKNTELEFDVSRLTMSLKRVQSELDRKNHTYTTPGYTATGGFRTANNGYQDWN